MEVLVSVTIMVVGVTVLLQSIINCLDANRTTQEFTRAIFLAESKLWEFERKYAFHREKSTGESTGEFKHPFHDFSWKSDIDGDESEVEYRIKVTIYWIHRGKEQQYSVATLVPMKRDEKDLKV